MLCPRDAVRFRSCCPAGRRAPTERRCGDHVELTCRADARGRGKVVLGSPLCSDNRGRGVSSLKQTRFFLIVALGAGTFAALGAGAFATASTAVQSATIVPGRSIGPIKIGMTRTAVYRALGQPGFTNVTGGNRTSVYDDWTITFRGAGASAPAFLVGSRITRYRTSKGVRVGSTAGQVRAAYPVARCYSRAGGALRFCRLVSAAGKTYFLLKAPGFQRVGSIMVAHRRVPDTLVTSTR